jgi:hypothetical protein
MFELAGPALAKSGKTQFLLKLTPVEFDNTPAVLQSRYRDSAKSQGGYFHERYSAAETFYSGTWWHL